MYAVLYFQVRGSRMLWVVLSLLFHVKTLWNIILTSEMQRSECQGYIMMHLKTFLIFFELLSFYYIQSIEHNQVSKYFESLTDIGNPFNDSLLLYFYYRICTKFSNTCPRISLFINIVPDISKVYFGKRKWCIMFIVFFLMKATQIFFTTITMILLKT